MTKPIHRDMVEVLRDLPPMCIVRNPSTGERVMVKRGHKGYWSMAGKSEEWLRSYNERHGVTQEQEEAMQCGSIFGFDVPGADPLNCGNPWDAMSWLKSAPANTSGPAIAKAIEGKLPRHMHGGVARYIAFGVRGGDFMMSVIEGRPIWEILGRADDDNIRQIRGWAEFVGYCIPGDARGSGKAAHEWCAKGGLRGIHAAALMALQEEGGEG